MYHKIRLGVYLCDDCANHQSWHLFLDQIHPHRDVHYILHQNHIWRTCRWDLFWFLSHVRKLSITSEAESSVNSYLFEFMMFSLNLP